MAVSFVQSGLPKRHPAALLSAVARGPIHGGGVEEFGGELGETTLAAQGTSEGREGLGQIIGTATATGAKAGTVEAPAQATQDSTSSEAGGAAAAEFYHDFTIWLAK